MVWTTVRSEAAHGQPPPPPPASDNISHELETCSQLLWQPEQSQLSLSLAPESERSDPAPVAVFVVFMASSWHCSIGRNFMTDIKQIGIWVAGYLLNCGQHHYSQKRMLHMAEMIAFSIIEP